jgi:hypothetical protein
LADAERAIADAIEVYQCAFRVVSERPPGVRDGDAADRRY